MRSNKMANLVHGDQFVGFNVDPTTGDLVFRYTVVVVDKPDANGRGVTRNVMEANRKTAKGRPIIFAPTVIGGGTRGHTNIHSMESDPYKYEVGRIVNLEPATKNVYERYRKGMIQTGSSLNDIVRS